MQKDDTDASIVSALLAWAAHTIRLRLRSVKPRYTTEEIAMAVARTGNPSGT